MQLTINDLIVKLNGVKYRSSDKIVANCPVCGKAGHFYATQKGEMLLVHCHKCSQYYRSSSDFFKAVLEVLGFRKTVYRPLSCMYTMGNKPNNHENGNNTRHGTLVENRIHAYKDIAGNVIYFKQRKKFDDGHKEFFFYHIADGHKVWRKPAVKSVLYNIDEIYKANASTVLFVVEGEKCADEMMKRGFLATTSDTGAKRKIVFSDSDKTLLSKFSRVVLMPDNDVAGTDLLEAYKYIYTDILYCKDFWADCPYKGDIADYFAAGGSVEVVQNWETYAVASDEVYRQIEKGGGTKKIADKFIEEMEKRNA